MIKGIKNRKVCILIASGILFCIIYIVIMKINNIPTQKNLAALVGIFITITPILIGLYIYSEEIKTNKIKLSIFIKVIICFLIIAFIGSSILILLKQFGLAKTIWREPYEATKLGKILKSFRYNIINYGNIYDPYLCFICCI